MRLPLEKTRKFLDSRLVAGDGTPVPVFPMDLGMLESLKHWLEWPSDDFPKACKSAAADLADNVAAFRALGLPVPAEEVAVASLSRRVLKAPTAPSGRVGGGREANGPKACIDVERLSVTGVLPGQREHAEDGSIVQKGSLGSLS